MREGGVRSLAQLERDLAQAERASKRAAEARSRLPPGSSRARVTTANARWMRAAEHRDRILAQVEALRAEQGAEVSR